MACIFSPSSQQMAHKTYAICSDITWILWSLEIDWELWIFKQFPHKFSLQLSQKKFATFMMSIYLQWSQLVILFASNRTLLIRWFLVFLLIVCFFVQVSQYRSSQSLQKNSAIFGFPLFPHGSHCGSRRTNKLIQENDNMYNVALRSNWGLKIKLQNSCSATIGLWETINSVWNTTVFVFCFYLNIYYSNYRFKGLNSMKMIKR